MITYEITITSKNPKSLKLFLLFCNQNNKKKYNLKTIFYKKINKKKIITILKSPHVNKKAQSQLEYKFFSTKILISSSNAPKHLILLKKIKSKLFPEIKFKTKFLINKQNNFKSQTQVLTPKNFTIINFNYNKIHNNNLQNSFIVNKKILNYIKVIDCFGELNLIQNIPLNNNCLDSSVGRAKD